MILPFLLGTEIMMGIAEDPLTRMERERDMRENPGKILKQGARMAVMHYVQHLVEEQ